MQNNILTSNHRIKTLPGGHKSFSYIPYSSTLISLFLMIAAYTVLPIVDVPLLGLSISAPLFFLIALETFFRAPKPWFREYRLWITFAIFICLGIVSSSLGNGLRVGTTTYSLQDMLAVIRFAYWLLFFVVTTYFVSYNKLGWRVAKWLAVAITVLALLRWWEVIVFGKIGAWVETRFLTQNDYGILFSSFAVILLSFAVSGRRRFLALLSTLVVWGAVAMNGSRSSWISVAISTLVFFFILMRSRSKFSQGLFAMIGLLLLAFTFTYFAPRSWIEPFEKRFSTFQRLDEDKSYAIRQLMVQKGLRLFQSHQFLGIGPSHFRTVSIELDIPSVLRYSSQGHFDEKSAHNSYILLLAETGLVGTIPFAILIVVLVFRGYKAAIFLSRQNELWAAAVFSGFIGMSIHLWALAGITNTSTWLMYGLVAAIIWLAKAKTEEATN